MTLTLALSFPFLSFPLVRAAVTFAFACGVITKFSVKMTIWALIIALLICEQIYLNQKFWVANFRYFKALIYVVPIGAQIFREHWKIDSL